MPKIRYLHKTREGIPRIYPQKSGDILQNMNFSRYYRNRGKFIYGFDPNIILSFFSFSVISLFLKSTLFSCSFWGGRSNLYEKSCHFSADLFSSVQQQIFTLNLSWLKPRDSWELLSTEKIFTKLSP